MPRTTLWVERGARLYEPRHSRFKDGINFTNHNSVVYQLLEDRSGKIGYFLYPIYCILFSIDLPADKFNYCKVQGVAASEAVLRLSRAVGKPKRHSDSARQAGARTLEAEADKWATDLTEGGGRYVCRVVVRMIALDEVTAHVGRLLPGNVSLGAASVIRNCGGCCTV